MSGRKTKKINIGCGKDIKEDYTNLDKLKSEGVDVVWDLDKYPYPFKDNSIDEILAFHILEHIKDYETCIDELIRILKPEGILHIKVPHFSSAGSNSEFHKRKFWYHSFSSERVYHKTSLEITFYDQSLEQVYKKINFAKPFFFMKLINFWIMPLIYENTGLCYLFPATEIEVKLRKLKNGN